MRPKLPSASQTRFLTERLLLKDPERLLLDDPLGFLDAFVRGFRLHIPFQTLGIASNLARNGRGLETSTDFIDEEIHSGRGGPCGYNNSFAQRFLSSVGFDADLVTGFVAARNQRRDAFHVSVFVKGVEEKKDVINVDVGMWPPHMRPVKMNMMSAGLASDPVKDIHLSHRFYSNAGFDGVINAATRDAAAGKDPEFPKEARFSPNFDWAALLGELRSGPALVSVFAKDVVMETVIPSMKNVKDGDLVPYYIVPSFNPIKFGDLIDETVGRPVSFSASLLCLTSGFSRTSGDFVVYTRDQRVRCRGTNHDGVGDGVILESNEEPEVRIPSTKDELVSLFHEDFPLLTDYFVDNLNHIENVERGETRGQVLWGR